MYDPEGIMSWLTKSGQVDGTGTDSMDNNSAKLSDRVHLFEPVPTDDLTVAERKYDFDYSDDPHSQEPQSFSSLAMKDGTRTFMEAMVDTCLQQKAKDFLDMLKSTLESRLAGSLNMQHLNDFPDSSHHPFSLSAQLTGSIKMAADGFSVEMQRVLADAADRALQQARQRASLANSTNTTKRKRRAKANTPSGGPVTKRVKAAATTLTSEDIEQAARALMKAGNTKGAKRNSNGEPGMTKKEDWPLMKSYLAATPGERKLMLVPKTLDDV